MLKKVNEKKVLHKVKKQWVVLGTALFALGTAGAYSESVHADTTTGDNHSSSTSVIASSATTPTSSSTAGSNSAANSSNDASVTSSESNSNSSTGTSSSASASQPATTTLQTDNIGQSVANTTDDDDISLREGDNDIATSRSFSNSSVSYSTVSSMPQVTANLGVSLSSASSGSSTTIEMSVIGNNTGDYKQLVQLPSYAIIYANNGSSTQLSTNNGNYGINNLVQYVQLSGSDIHSSAIDPKSYSSYVSFNSSYSIPSNINSGSGSGQTIGLPDPNNSKSAASSASVLTFNSGPIGSGYYLPGDKVWWTFDIVSNPNFSGSSYTYYYPTYSTIKTSPVTIKFMDKENFEDSSTNGQQFQSDQYLAGSNIYPGDTFSLSSSAPDFYGYEYEGIGYEGNVKTSAESGNNYSASGTFIDPSIIYVDYKKVPVPVSVTYFDSTANKNITLSGASDPTSLSGEIGSLIDYSTQDVVNSLTSEGYSLVSGNPSTSLTVSSDSASNSYTFTFVHNTITYNGNNSSYPNGLTKSDFAKSFTRTINFVDSATNSSISSAETQNVTYTRSRLYDAVTNQPLSDYSSWSAASSSFPEFDAPSINGYGNPSPASEPAKSVDYSDSTTEFSATIAYTKSSSQSSYASSATSSVSYTYYSASSSDVSSTATSSYASSSATPSSTSAIKMYNDKTQLVKQDGKILIFIEPKYAPFAGNGSLSDQYVVNRQLPNGQVSHSQEITLDQYNSMLTASWKQPYTPETLNEAYIRRNFDNNIMKNRAYKTTFDANVVKQGNDVLIDTSAENNGFSKPADHKLVVIVYNKPAKDSTKQHANKHKSQKKAKRAHKHVKKTEHHVTKHTHHVKHDRKHNK